MVKSRTETVLPGGSKLGKNETNGADIIIIHDTYLINEIIDINW